jgi:hypothetical protein
VIYFKYHKLITREEKVFMKNSMKKLLVLGLILLSAVVWFGCKVEESDPVAAAKDQITGGAQNTVATPTSVVIADLSQTFSGTLPSTKEVALEILGDGYMSQMFAAIGDYMDYIGEFYYVNDIPPTGVTYTESGNETSFTQTMSITNGTFNESTPVLSGYYQYNGTGGLSVPSASMTMSYSEVSEMAFKATINASIRASAANMRYTVDYMLSDYTLNQGLLNGNVNAAVLFEETDTAGSIYYNVGAKLRGGAVISPASESVTGGGKFIVSMDFANKGSFTYDETAGTETSDLGTINLTVTVAVYNDSNNLVATYTYTADDLEGFADTSDLMLSMSKSIKSKRLKR